MESVKSVSPTSPSELFHDLNKTGSPENFKKCIYELFHSNGVLNDLRAYLRGHIINVLKSSRAGEGEPPLCQKRFTQRLEPKFQALNMLIAEYLFCMEFSYSFSVFLAEIPLANMVFEFAKTLMNVGPHGEAFGLRFKDRDVWSILNCLGVRCDSEQAINIVEMYKKEDEPSLLFCIMTCVQLCSGELNYPHFSREESSSSCKTSELERQSHAQPTPLRKKCNHSMSCYTCRSNFSRLHEKFGKKKKQFTKNSNQHVDPLVMESFMKKVGFLERKLMDETIDHVTSVYELQVNMVKTEQEESMKRSLASHAVHFKDQQTKLEESFKARSAALAGSLDRKKRFLWGLARALRAQHAHMARAMCAVRALTERLAEKLEESFKARSAALAGSLDRKKRFLWGLARALRAQHAHMARAMCAVRALTERLAEKEQNIKDQLLNAEESLKTRCEEMHGQIAEELSHLEEHIEAIKSERDVLHRERSELDNLKKDSENKLESVELKSHYDLLKSELTTLKTYFEDSLQKSRFFLERSTITDLNGVHSNITLMNNEVDRTVPKEEARPTQVVNNLKKMKNVNFGQQSCSELAGSGSCSSSPVQPTVVRLLHENERLRLLAEQQTTQLTEMSAHAARLQAALHRRPRATPQRSTGASVSSNSFGWCKGAGEELSFSLGRPQILVPGDAVPFVGVVGERRAAKCSRHLMNQIRRSSPCKSATKQWPAHPSSPKEQTDGHVISVSSPQSTHCGAHAAAPSRDVRGILTSVTESRKPREKSPNSVLREAKERLKTVARPLVQRQASPSAMLREAKLRLRKLEIEAEAVEQSYLTFRRRRQCRDFEDDENLSQSEDEIDDETQEQRAGHSKSMKECNDLLKVNLDKYLKKYQNEYDIGPMHFRNKNTVNEIKKPIPKAFSDHLENSAKSPKRDYLNIPMMDFRNLYSSRSEGKPRKSGAVSKAQSKGESDLMSNSEKIKAANENLSKVLNLGYNKQQTDLNKLQNMSMIYDLRDVPTKEHPEKPEERPEGDDENLLRVEVESVETTFEAVGPSERSVTLTIESRAEAAGPRYDSRLDSSSTVAVPTMTIVVSPKRPPEEPALTRHDVLHAIYGVRAQLRRDPARDSARGPARDSADDDSFSADVDNYAAGDERRRSPNKTDDDDVSWG